MGIDKEQLGINVELMKKFTLNEISSISTGLEETADKVNTISIAQKTVNTRGIKELLASEVIIPFSSATVNGNGVATSFLQNIPLSDNIENYNFVYIQAAIRTDERQYNSRMVVLPVKNIVYNPTDTFQVMDRSAVTIPFEVDSNLPGAFGEMHFVLRGWFKNNKLLFFDAAMNPSTNPAFNKIAIISVQGVSIENVTIDPVEYVNTTQGIEDTPIGNIISMAGSEAPPHYLKCDGTEYNIVDYPYLSQYIKDQFGKYNVFGGDGITTFAVPEIYEKSSDEDMLDITPKMTSATTPTPYKVTQSSYLASGGLDRSGWKAFDKSNIYDSTGKNVTYWTTNNTPIGWVTFDFGSRTSVTHFSITTRTKYSTDPAYAPDSPKNFSVYGSNNDIDYELVTSITNQIEWGWDTTRVFNFGKKVSYRYYKLDVSSNNGATYTSVVELKYLFNLNSTKYIKYEPTYFMNIQGLIEETTLWEGISALKCVNNAWNTLNTDISLAGSILDYDEVRLSYSWYRTSDKLAQNFEQKSFVVKDIQLDKSLLLNIVSIFQIICEFAFVTNNQVKVYRTYGKDISQTSADAINLTKIVGIKYKTFQGGNN